MDLAKYSLFVHPKVMNTQHNDFAQSGKLLARGAARHLSDLGFVSLEEFVPRRGLRLDLFALGPKGELWIIECKSSKADFKSDDKWQNYLEWGDKFFWVVDSDFPTDILPQKTGLIIGDAYDAALIREAPYHPVAPTRRKTLVHKFATKAAERLHRVRDPCFMSSF
tara:strand:- start:383 stop:880 length:498 start_codon:yes stop_codon:yes gene_type:complete